MIHCRRDVRPVALAPPKAEAWSLEPSCAWMHPGLFDPLDVDQRDPLRRDVEGQVRRGGQGRLRRTSRTAVTWRSGSVITARVFGVFW